MMQVLVTGADGFVGRVLCRDLSAAGYAVRRAVRADLAAGASRTAPVYAVGDLGPATDWRAALAGASCVVHLAARTHVIRETAHDPPAEFARINVDATRRLAEQAAASGVRRFVFVSSIKVNGESTGARPFTESDAPSPEDAYGISKWHAEQQLARAAVGTGLDTVILRPPLVYGPGVRGNFLRLLRLVARGVPLPVSAVENRRSLLYVGNLTHAICTAIGAPQAGGRTYLLCDGEDFSTPELVRALAAALEVRPRLLPFPPRLLRRLAAALGREGEVARLTGSLQIDASCIRRELGWQSPYTLAHGLAETARWYHIDRCKSKRPE